MHIRNLISHLPFFSPCPGRQTGSRSNQWKMGVEKTIIRPGNGSGVRPSRGQTVNVHCTGYGTFSAATLYWETVWRCPNIALSTHITALTRPWWSKEDIYMWLVYRKEWRFESKVLEYTWWQQAILLPNRARKSHSRLGWRSDGNGSWRNCKANMLPRLCV